MDDSNPYASPKSDSEEQKLHREWWFLFFAQTCHISLCAWDIFWIFNIHNLLFEIMYVMLFLWSFGWAINLEFHLQAIESKTKENEQ